MTANSSRAALTYVIADVRIPYDKVRGNPARRFRLSTCEDAAIFSAVYCGTQAYAASGLI